jgi:hypothetical protein
MIADTAGFSETLLPIYQSTRYHTEEETTHTTFSSPDCEGLHHMLSVPRQPNDCCEVMTRQCHTLLFLVRLEPVQAVALAAPGSAV